MTNTDDKVGPSEELSTQFSRATTTIRIYTSRFENDVCQPTMKLFYKTFEKRPVLATFLATLAILCYFPALAFVTASTWTLATFVIIALVISLSASFAVIFALLCILISTLVASVFLAAVITAACFDIYLAFRLVSLVRQNGASDGFLCWIDEIWKHINTIGSITPFPIRRRANPATIQHRQLSDQFTEVSDLDTKVEEVENVTN